jgi:signal transduction histidine kinase
MLAVELERVQDDPAQFRSRLAELREHAAEISNNVHALSHDLHSSKLEYLGVVAGTRSWCKEFSGRQRIGVDFKSGVQSVLPIEIGRTLFRILQEALHNASKHSGASVVEVQLQETPGEIHMIVNDSGKGFNVEAALQGSGLGLISMQERVRMVKGTISIESQPQRGTRIHIRVPIPSEQDAQRVAG